jgi:ABC-2 type transport system ATP-binding protein
MQQIAIEAIHLTRWYNSYVAVDKISFAIPTNTIFGLLGPNGAGKSTTIKMLITLLPPTCGTATVDGFDIIKDALLVRQRIGYVPQLLSADGELTGYENLLISAKLYGLPAGEREKRIAELLQFMGLSEYADQLVNQYSGGMIRRLEIAQALVHQPSILFLDEPSIGLDPAARKTLWAIIKEWKNLYGTTILISTHDMLEADRICDIVAFMHLGHIIRMDSPAKLKEEMGKEATLDDVFLKYTGTSIQEGGDFRHAKQIRRTISHLD